MPLDQQERACRQSAADAGVPISARDVFLDARSVSWQQGRPGRAWSALLAALRTGAFAVLFLYGIEALARHAPGDLADLLDLCDTHAVALHDPRDGREWNDSGARAGLAVAVVRARRAAQNAAETTRKLQEEEVAAGRPHGGGLRAFGYTAGYRALIESEAAIVREMFARYVTGESLSALAADLNARGVPAAAGGRWSSSRVARLLDAPRYAGLRVVRGQVARDADGNALRGAWPPCVSEQDWLEAQALRREHARMRASQQQVRRDYLLAGLVECLGCARSMAGSMIGTYRTYACPGRDDVEPERCARHIGAQSLEAFTQDHALSLLEQWDPDTPLDVPLAVSTAAVVDHERRNPVRFVVRDAAALDGVVAGQDARENWQALTQARRAAALRFLFAAIRIGPKTTARGVFDDSRIVLIPGPLPRPGRGM